MEQRTLPSGETQVRIGDEWFTVASHPANVQAVYVKSVPPTWHPIDSAPEDVPVLTCQLGDELSVGIATKDQSGYWRSDEGTQIFHEPTHWMPLPPALMEER